MGMGNAPIVILKEGTKRDKGKDAQFNNIAAARTISDAVRSSLGPRGMDKMLVDSMGDVIITNDGVTIAKEITLPDPFENMGANLIKEVSISMENKGYNPLAYRLFCLQSHYKNQLVFSCESLDIAQNTYNKLISKINSVKTLY